MPIDPITRNIFVARALEYFSKYENDPDYDQDTVVKAKAQSELNMRAHLEKLHGVKQLARLYPKYAHLIPK